MNTISNYLSRVLLLLLTSVLVAGTVWAQSSSPLASQWRNAGGIMVAKGGQHYVNGWFLAQNGKYWKNDENQRAIPPEHSPEEVNRDVLVKKGRITLKGPGRIGRALWFKGNATAYLIEPGAKDGFIVATLGSQRMNKVNGRWSGTWVDDIAFRKVDLSKPDHGWIPAGVTKTFDVYCRSDWNDFGAWGRGYAADKDVQFEFWYFPVKDGKVISSTVSNITSGSVVPGTAVNTGVSQIVPAPKPASAVSNGLLFPNSDFEKGNLMNWSASGNAFDVQPSRADNPTARHRGQPSQHQGVYWIGTYEKYQGKAGQKPGDVQGDAPTGVLTSTRFTIQAPVISFLIGGGAWKETVYVSLLVDNKEVRRATGKNTETLSRQTWNVAPFVGKSARILIVDKSSGGWGHINADDFRYAVAGGSVSNVPSSVSPVAPPVSMSIQRYPMADSHVYAYAYLNWNKADWGKYSVLGAGYHPTGGEKRTYLKFNLKGISSGSFKKAVLRLYHYHTGGRPDLTLGVYRVLQPWDEGNGLYKPPTLATGNELSWVQQPQSGPNTFAQFRPGAGVNKWVEVDITPLVKAWLNGTPNHGLVIKGAGTLSGRSESQYGFYSREHDDAGKRPQLVIN
ncbi:MAG: DNRLRE domain-containing protein [Chlorobium sp.]|nr:DNRLRE domain-containing protein [Chlorobium sp.]